MRARGIAPGVAAIVLALAGAVGLQVVRDRVYPPEPAVAAQVLYVRSPEVASRLALAFDALAADVYWIRSLQHYGGTRRDPAADRSYPLLYPLLDLTTSLDPYFTIAYRFGAIFLSEPQPGGPGRPDLAVALLRKGIQAEPGKWQYYLDLGFVHYWHRQDFLAAADWFTRAAEQPRAPNWLGPLAATTLVVGGDRGTARFMWQQILEAEEAWLRRTARRSLMQLDAVERAEQLAALLERFTAPGASFTWDTLVRQGVLSGVPLDPAGTPFEVDPETGAVRVSPASPLWPLPRYTGLPVS